MTTSASPPLTIGGSGASSTGRNTATFVFPGGAEVNFPVSDISVDNLKRLAKDHGVGKFQLEDIEGDYALEGLDEIVAGGSYRVVPIVAGA